VTKYYKKMDLERRKEIGVLLMETYPKAFFKKRRKALKVGIANDLLEQLNSSQVSPEELRAFLWWYTFQNDYLHSVAKDTHRIDLEGNQAGEILERHRVSSRSILEKRAKKSRDHQTDKKK
jgi:ProP effector